MRPKGGSSPPSNLYRHAYDTPLQVFIDCVCGKDYNSLIRYGKPTEDQVQQAWECLYTEYMDISGNSSYRHVFTMIKQTGKLESQLMTVRLCLDVLRYRPSPKCIKIIQDYGYRMKFDWNNKASYLADLKLLAQKSKALEFNLQRMRSEYIRTAEGVKDNEITRDHFQASCASLSVYTHYEIDPKEITVGMYAHLQKLYKKEVERSKEISAKYKSKDKGKRRDGDGD